MQEYEKRTRLQTPKDIIRDKVGANIALYVTQKIQQLLTQKYGKATA